MILEYKKREGATSPKRYSPPRARRERDCEALRLSIDHKPNLATEQRRIVASGGAALSPALSLSARQTPLVDEAPFNVCSPFVSPCSPSFDFCSPSFDVCSPSSDVCSPFPY